MNERKQPPFRTESVTNDFVHFVIHKAATSGGCRCEMCAGDEEIRYVPSLFPILLTEMQAAVR